MTTLYIIGNGFDLWHGLPTRYSDFYEHSRTLLDDVSRYFNLDGDDRPWADFETDLGTYNWMALFHEYNFTNPSSESFRVSETYSLEDELQERSDDLHRSIAEGFEGWVDGIDVTSASPRMTFEEDASFITFNYTDTLQCVYGVPDCRILHIHGKAERGHLVFGHGVEIGDSEPELDERGDSNRDMFTNSKNAARYPLMAFRKNTAQVLEDCGEFFTRLQELTHIEVIGHSLSDVDLPYFRELADRHRGCKWTVWCFDLAEREHLQQQLTSCGVDINDIELRPYPDP